MTHTRELAVIVGATFRQYLQGPQLTPPQERVAEVPALDPLAPLGGPVSGER